MNRRVLLGIRHPDYFDATRFEYDYAILGRAGLREGLDRAMNARVLRTFGDETDPFACYAVLLVPARRADWTGVSPPPTDVERRRSHSFGDDIHRSRLDQSRSLDVRGSCERPPHLAC